MRAITFLFLFLYHSISFSQESKIENMVNPFTGDLNYQIPLLSVPGPNGGYPLNMSYSSSVGMLDEASWVGLGWSLNVGEIKRDVNGLPDDFKNDNVIVRQDLKNSWNLFFELGGSIGAAAIIPNIGFRKSKSISYSNFTGISSGRGESLYIGLGGSELGLNIGSNSSTTSPSEVFISSGLKDFKEESRDKKFKEYPSLKLPFETEGKSFNLTFGVSAGVGIGKILSVGGGGDISVFYSKEFLKYKNTFQNKKAVGYNYMENINDDNVLIDFNRQGDAIKAIDNSGNLPIPYLQKDDYYIVTPLLNSKFETYRPEIGSIFDPYTYSKFKGEGFSGSIGLTFPIPSFSAGGNWTKGSNKISYWYNSTNRFQFGGQFTNISFFESKLYKKYFYRLVYDTHSSQNGVYNHIGNSEVVSLKPSNAVYTDEPEVQGNLLFDKSGQIYNNTNVSTNTISTKKSLSGNIINDFTNEELSTTNSFSLGNNLSEFNFDYYELGNNPLNVNINSYSTNNKKNQTNIDRNIKHHIGAFQVLTEDGLRMNFGLPVYTNKKVEATYSTGSDYNHFQLEPGIHTCVDEHVGNKKSVQFLERVETPKHATDFLITSIVGSDYVDVDFNGVSDNDLGYWVKFNYVKIVGNNQKYRFPFSNAFYLQNSISKDADDLVSYSYSEKEQYYISSIETKSHIAYFELEHRSDLRSAVSELQTDNSQMGSYSYALKRIKLFSKNDLNTALQIFSFDYNYQLSSGSPNSSAGGNGKLTLKTIKVDKENSQRLSDSFYEFEYNTSTPFNYFNKDGWGNYKDNLTGTDKQSFLDNITYPYTKQFHHGNSSFNNNLNFSANVNKLKNIVLPGGSSINVEYESDDYAYVQNEPAAQMFNIVSMLKTPYQCTSNEDHAQVFNKDYKNNFTDPTYRRIYFELETEISSNLPQNEADNLVKEKYIRGTEQIYFKVKTHLTNKSHNPKLTDYVEGYLDIDKNMCGVVTPPNGGNYKYGFVQLKLPGIISDAAVNASFAKFHPLALSCWHHLRYNFPEYPSLLIKANLLNDPDGLSQKKFKKRMKKLFNKIKAVNGIYLDLYKNGSDFLWSSELFNDIEQTSQGKTLKTSFIRLYSPDNKKIGGGARVSKITVNDGWANTDESFTYGSVFEYNNVNEKGEKISSGVASFEPFALGGENSLRKAIGGYNYKVNTKTSAFSFFEAPFNQYFFPSPEVNYSKVTIKSITTQQQIDNIFSDNIAGTGAKVYDFYTYKDYPVITDATIKYGKPLISPNTKDRLRRKVKETRYVATQGYKIELNNMHGKLKKVSLFSQNADGTLESEPFYFNEYIYKSNIKYLDNKKINVLNNSYEVLLADGQKEEREVGVSYDLFADLKQSKLYSEYKSEGFAFPDAWNGGKRSVKETKQVNTGVMNKIIQRTGLLEKTIVYDRGNTNEFINKYLDPITGNPLLTLSSNNFNETVFNYSMPARWYYDNMGAADINIGITFLKIKDIIEEFSFTQQGPVIEVKFENNIASATDEWKMKYIRLGDEILCSKINNDGDIINNNSWSLVVEEYIYNNNLTIAGFKARFKTGVALQTLNNNNTDNYKIKVIRSGNRNLLNTIAGTIESIKPLNTNTDYDPATDPGQNTPTQCTFDVPKDNTNCLPCLNNLAAILNAVHLAPDNVTGIKSTFLNGLGEINKGYFIADLEGFVNLQQNQFNDESRDFCLGNKIVDFYSVGKLNSFYFNCNNNTGRSNIDVTNCYDNCTWLMRDVISGQILEPPYVVTGFFNAYNLIQPNTPTSVSEGFYGLQQIGIRVSKDGTERSYFIYSNCNWCSPTFDNPIMSFTTNYTENVIQDVINASATTFSDFWDVDYNHTREICPDGSSNCNNSANAKALSGYMRSSLSPYITGEKGIWRPEASYAYFHNRKQTLDINTNINVNLKRDGVFPLHKFNWKNPLNALCNSRWRLQQRVHKYNHNGQAVEVKDILDRPSATITGDRYKKDIASASLSGFYEMGHETFEYYMPGTGVIDQYNSSAGNLLIYDRLQQEQKTIYYEYEVISGQGNMVKISEPFSSFPFNQNTISNVKVIATTAGTKSNGTTDNQYERVYENCSITNIYEGNNNETVIEIEPSQPGFVYDNDNKIWTGKILIPKIISIPPNFTGNDANISITDSKSHTGKNSLKMEGVGSTVNFTQYLLQLKPGNKYLISMWIYAKHYENYPQPFTNALDDINYLNIWIENADNGIVLANLKPKGEPIDGWRQIEGTIELPNGKYFPLISIMLNGLSTYYFDDIRIAPFNAATQTNVYDNKKDRLINSIDENNFATFYDYDEKGQLYQIRKETEKGIYSTQEIKANIKRND